MSGQRSVLFVNGSETIEGDTRVLLYAVHSLKSAGYVCTAITAPGPAAVALRELGIDVRVAALGPGRRLLAGKAGEAMAFVEATVAVMEALRSTGARVLYTYDRTRAVESAYIGARLLRRKLVFHAQNLPFLEHRRVRKHVAFHAICILCISQYIAEQFAAARAPKEKLRVVLNGADPSAIVPTRSFRDELALHDAQVVGVVGRLSPFKGQEELIRSAAILRMEFPRLRVLIAGRDTEESVWTHGPAATSYRRVLEDLVSELSLQGVVHILGFTNAADVYASSDVVVAPSHAEPFGLVVIEGMLAGKPVVSTNAGGVPEIIDDGRTGVLVEPRNPTLLADAIRRLLVDPALRDQIAAAGQAHARRHFST